MSTILQAALVAAMAVGVILAGGTLDLDHAWPVLLAAAVGLAGPARPGRIAAYVAGAMTAWTGAAIGAAALPQTAGAQALIIAGAVAVLAAIAAASRRRMPLWAGLAGYAAFAALYQPMYAARPTAFLTESPAALQTILLAGAIGFLAALLADFAPARRQAAATSAAAAATDPIQVVIDLTSGGEITPEPADHASPARSRAAAKREKV